MGIQTFMGNACIWGIYIHAIKTPIHLHKNKINKSKKKKERGNLDFCKGVPLSSTTLFQPQPGRQLLSLLSPSKTPPHCFLNREGWTSGRAYSVVAIHHHVSTEKPSKWLKVTQESVVEPRFKLGALTLAKDGGHGLQPLPSKEALDR